VKDEKRREEKRSEEKGREEKVKDSKQNGVKHFLSVPSSSHLSEFNSDLLLNVLIIRVNIKFVKLFRERINADGLIYMLISLDYLMRELNWLKLLNQREK
jgi:hypothetical protein